MTDPERVDKDEQIDWANDCNDLRILAKAAEAAVRREEYDKAHDKLNEIAHRVEWVSEEYPRYIHEAAKAGVADRD